LLDGAAPPSWPCRLQIAPNRSPDLKKLLADVRDCRSVALSGTRYLEQACPQIISGRVTWHGGKTVEERNAPRASFPRFDPTTPWDAAQVAYFTSYAVWNYLTAPFLFTYPRVETCEIEPWQEDGQTWRRLQVRFPNTIVTHNPEQIFYYDTDFMLRRLDYQPQVTAAPIAHYVNEAHTFDGFVFPTRRRVFRRRPDGTADQSLAVITLTFDKVTIKRH
jgi:hypothetical protein